jgi:hypothetical protein
MRLSRRLLVIALLLCLLISLACVAYPIYVIRPFRSQGARELAAALAVSRYRSPVTFIATVISAGCLVLYWAREKRRSFRALAAAAFCATAALVVLARINVYEIMFHPNEHPAFKTAADMKLDQDEKVIAVKVGSIARAYPIRGLAYHHIANDVVDKLAIVATY